MRNDPTQPDDPPRAGASQLCWLRLSAVAGLFVGLAFCAALPASAAAKSKPKARVTFGVEPASASGADGRPDLSFGVTPGAVLADYVAVLNYSSLPLSLQVYATDAIETPNGGFGLLPVGTRPTGVGAWISLPSLFATVHVPVESSKGPGQVVVPIVLRVPDSATPGDHAGGVVASLRTTGTNSSGQKIVLVQRVGTRVFVRVSGKLTPKLSLTDLHASYQGTLNPIGQGKAKVSYLVSNTGNVDVALDQSVSLSGLLGSKRQLALTEVPLLLPGASLHESVVVPGVWPEVFLHATVSAEPLAPVGTSVAGLEPLGAKASLWAIPWSLLGLVVLVLLAAFGTLRVRASRAARRLAGPTQLVNA